IRYAWSGTPGDPLTWQYNGGAAITIAEPVEAFSLAYTTEAGALKAPPRVLLVSKDPTAPSQDETARRQAMQSCGFFVQSIADDVTPAQFATALQSADVVYTLPETNKGDFADKPTNISQGVVVADKDLYVAYGVGDDDSENDGDTVDVSAMPHPVTNGFSAGAVKICSSQQNISFATTLAPGAAQLATTGEASDQVALFAVDWGGQLTSGAAAAGRRIAGPSGRDSFDYTTLTAEGVRLERNAILWAAAPKVVARVTITVQVGADASGRVASDVQLLNLPEATE
ncbi:MAG: hypothetical protein V2A79_14225, partial [Planctomycetota bacterium]